ncbi:hypothetical protein CsSME_00033871 [Camellia sinensis var. sinensis]
MVSQEHLDKMQLYQNYRNLWNTDLMGTIQRSVIACGLIVTTIDLICALKIESCSHYKGQSKYLLNDNTEKVGYDIPGKDQLLNSIHLFSKGKWIRFLVTTRSLS